MAYVHVVCKNTDEHIDFEYWTEIDNVRGQYYNATCPVCGYRQDGEI